MGALFLVALKKDWIVTGKECRRRVEQHSGQQEKVYESNTAQLQGDGVYISITGIKELTDGGWP